MMGRRQKLKTGDEVDVVGHRDTDPKRPEGLRKIKRQMNKRERREAKEAIRKDTDG